MPAMAAPPPERMKQSRCLGAEPLVVAEQSPPSCMSGHTYRVRFFSAIAQRGTMGMAVLSSTNSHMQGVATGSSGIWRETALASHTSLGRVFLKLMMPPSLAGKCVS